MVVSWLKTGLTEPFVRDEKRCHSACYTALSKKWLMKVVCVVVVVGRGEGVATPTQHPQKRKRSRIIFLLCTAHLLPFNKSYPYHSTPKEELLSRLYRSTGASTTLCKTLTGLFNIPILRRCSSPNIAHFLTIGNTQISLPEPKSP